MRLFYNTAKFIISIFLVGSPFAFAADATTTSAPHSAVRDPIHYLNACQKALSATDVRPLDTTKQNEWIHDLVSGLKDDIVGQDYAIETMSKAFEIVLATLNDPKKPFGSLLFTGPTGVGKTELVRALVKLLKGNPDFHLIRIDGGEMQFGHEVSRLIGTTAGYKGYGDQPALHPDELATRRITIEFKNGKTIELNIVLFDELEKMSDEAFNLLLGILDNGKATMGDNTETFMRKTLIFGTSNLGAKEVEKIIDQKKEAIRLRQERGEILTAEDLDLTGRLDIKLRTMIGDAYVKALKEKYKPEFINRWLKIIQFLHLGDEEFLKIADIQLAGVQKRIFERAENKFAFHLSKETKRWLIDQRTDFRNGARELNDIITLTVTQTMARMLSSGEIKDGDVIEAIIEQQGENKSLKWLKIAHDLSRDELLQFSDREFPGRKMLKTQFDVATDEPIVESKEIVGAIVDELNKNQAAARHIWTESNKIEYGKASIKEVGSSIEVAELFKYILIGKHVIRLSATDYDMDSNVDIEVVLSSDGVPPSHASQFTVERMNQWSVEQVEEIISRSKQLGPRKNPGKP
ncbi:MAG: ATP-dependent Clp protease ATP-binding subunit [Bdellovibrionales bacterium]|nr:ATP-dependent Clp protease ATP-binding subunit [Bdellovibrionales bacterium]